MRKAISHSVKETRASTGNTTSVSDLTGPEKESKQLKLDSLNKPPQVRFSNVAIHASPLYIQPKLTVNTQGDKYEQEADAMADKVMRMTDTETLQTTTSDTNIIRRKCESCGNEEEEDDNVVQRMTIQRKCAKCEEEEKEKKLQRKETTSASPKVSSAVMDTLRSSGQALDNSTRSFMEQRFGFDLGNVRIHNNSRAHQSAKDINASAYTHQNHIVFGTGQYQPHSNSGKKLLAHELTHVLQQGFDSSKLVQRQPAPSTTAPVTSTPAPPPIVAPDISIITSDIIAGIQADLVTFAQLSTTEETANDLAIQATPRRTRPPKRRIPFSLIMKYLWLHIVLPQLKKPTKTKRKFDEKYSTLLSSDREVLSGLYDQSIIDAIVKYKTDANAFAADQLKTVKRGKKKEQKKIVDKLTKDLFDAVEIELLRTVEQEYTVKRMGVDTDAIVDEFNNMLKPKTRGLIEGGISGYYATRKALLATFGDASYPKETLEALNNYVNSLVQPTFLRGAADPSNTLVHTDLNNALNSAEALMKTKGWHAEIMAAGIRYWSTNIRENRNNPSGPSDHMFGLAVDINAGTNPNLAQVPSKDWAFIDKMLGTPALNPATVTPIEKEVRDDNANNPDAKLASVEKLRALSERYKAFFSSQAAFVKRIAQILNANGLTLPVSEIEKALIDYLSASSKAEKQARARVLTKFFTDEWRNMVYQTTIRNYNVPQPIESKIEKVLQSNIKTPDRLKELQTLITDQITNPKTQIPTLAKRRNISGIYSSAINRELNLIPAANRPTIAQSLLSRLELTFNLSDADKKAKENTTWTLDALKLFESAQTNLSKSGTDVTDVPGNLAGISAFGFTNLPPKLITALIVQGGGNLNWLGVANNDMHHFQLKQWPVIPKATPPPAPVAPKENEATPETPGSTEAPETVAPTEQGPDTLEEEENDDLPSPDSPPIQFKLQSGSSNDPLEEEADSMADKIMGIPEGSQVLRKCAECDEEEENGVQRKSVSQSITPATQINGDAGAIVSSSLTSRINSSKNGGCRMDHSILSLMSTRFGVDFAKVKIHTDNDAIQMSRELNAKAFTVGNNIYFNAGCYSPSSESSKHLLAHELTHVIQQRGTNNERNTSQIQRDLSVPEEEPPLESDDALLACMLLVPPVLWPFTCFAEKKKVRKHDNKQPTPEPSPNLRKTTAPKLNFYHGTRWSIAKTIPGNVKAIGGGDFSAGFYTHHDADDKKAEGRAIKWGRVIANKKPSEPYAGVIRFGVPENDYRQLFNGGKGKVFDLKTANQNDYKAKQKEWIDFITSKGRFDKPAFKEKRKQWVHDRRDPQPELPYNIVEGPFYTPLSGPKDRMPANEEFKPYAEGNQFPQQVSWANEGIVLLNSPKVETELKQYDAKTGQIKDPPDNYVTTTSLNDKELIKAQEDAQFSM